MESKGLHYKNRSILQKLKIQILSSSRHQDPNKLFFREVEFITFQNNPCVRIHWRCHKHEQGTPGSITETSILVGNNTFLCPVKIFKDCISRIQKAKMPVEGYIFRIAPRSNNPVSYDDTRNFMKAYFNKFIKQTSPEIRQSVLEMSNGHPLKIATHSIRKAAIPARVA